MIRQNTLITYLQRTSKYKNPSKKKCMEYSNENGAVVLYINYVNAAALIVYTQREFFLISSYHHYSHARVKSTDIINKHLHHRPINL